MKFPSSLRPGIVVLLGVIAIYAIPIRWIETRRFTPLETPISISDGRFRTNEFKINLAADYYVNFDRPYDASAQYSNCPYEAQVSTKWTVFKNNKPIVVSVPAASGEQPWRRIDSFAAGPGIYSIEVEVLPGAECLNVARMQLSVWTSDGEYQSLLTLLRGACIFLGAIGIVLLVRADPESFRERSHNSLRDRPQISESPGYSRNFGSRKRRPMSLFHGLPNFGMLYFVSVFPGMIAMMILTIPSPSMGVKTHLVRPMGIHAHADPRSKALLVWLDAHGNYFVNDKQVAHNDLADALKRELSLPAEWTVYFEADGNASFGDAAFAMSEIRNAAGKVVWLTPKTRQEFAAQDPIK